MTDLVRAVKSRYNSHKKRLPTVQYKQPPTLKQLLKLFVKQNNICAICSKPFTLDDFHLDHKRPLSRGGWHCIENIQYTHASCNATKGLSGHKGYPPEDFVPNYYSPALCTCGDPACPL